VLVKSETEISNPPTIDARAIGFFSNLFFE
jgi:hypothetical protein